MSTPTETLPPNASRLLDLAHGFQATGHADRAREMGRRAGRDAQLSGLSLDTIHASHTACKSETVWGGVVDGWFESALV